MKKQRLIAALLTVTMLLGTVGLLTTPASAVSPGTQVPPVITYATDAGAFLKDIQLSQTAAWNLTVNSTPTADGQTYAVLLRYDLFNTNYNSDGSIGGVNSGTYTNLAPGTANSNYYRYQNETVPKGAENVQKTIFNKNLYNFTQDSHYPLGETSTTYHMRYALIIFDGGTTTQNLSDYTIVDFYINSDGWLQTESYMLRYQRNLYPAGYNAADHMPPYQIEAWGSDALVNVENRYQPTRTGYTFLGWDANNRLMNADANTAARQTVTPQYPAGNAGPVPWSTISAVTGTTFSKTADKFYDLHAVWRPKKVEFDLASATKTTTVNGVNLHVLTLPEPQVGKAYSQTVTLGLEANGYTTAADTSKAYSWVNIGQNVSFVNDDSVTETGTTVNLTTAHQLSVAAVNNTQWRITGKPTAHSNGKPVFAVLQVKDSGNNTTDLIVLRFKEVKKGAQPIPSLDVNTGLQSQVAELLPEQLEQLTDEQKSVLAEGNKDGQIFGFYAAGPKKDTGTEYTPDDTGYRDTIDGNNTGLGNGTMTSYYINNRMIYEYRPVKVGGADVDYTGLPNEGWREMPMPKNWYGAAYITGTTRTAFENSLTLNAKDVITTGYAPGTGSHAPVTVITNLSDSFKANGWPDSYGWIEWADDTATALPILHGLKADDVYEIRFRQNTNFSASDPKTVTIGGVAASSGGGSSAGLLFNLMRGSVWQIPKPTEPEPPTEVDVTTISVTMGEGGTATITNVKLEEATEPTPETPETTADEGEEPGTEPTEPTSVTINAGETKNLNVLAQPVTVTVTPAEGFEAHTVTVTADEAPLTPAEGVYTLPGKTVTGTLALNISLTAPETPPDTPAARAAVTTETDVTDTLFAASPTGTLPDGTALGLGEGETLQLRDPDGVEVESITFYVSATGSVENTDGGAGLFDTYVCTLNETKTALVWTKVVNEVSAPVTGVDLGGTFKSLAAQFGGKANPSDFVTVVCYDWDETLLGSVTVPKGESADVVEGYMNDFVRALQSPESKDVDDSKASFFVDNGDFPLTYKRGYSFNCWLPNDSELPTHCGRNYNGDNSPIVIPNPAETGDAQDFANLQTNITVKACYQDNSELYYTDDPTQLNYTLEVAKYSRIGATTTYIITYRFMRQTTIEENGVERVVGVPRLAEPQFRLIYNGNLYNFFALGSSDIVTFTAYPNGNTVTQANAVMVDFYQASVITNASAKTAAQSDSNGATVTDRDGFRHKGTLSMINEELAANSTRNLTAVVLRVQAGLTYTNLNAAQTNLRTAWVKLNSEDGTEATIKPEEEWKDLTFEQMNYAIANDGNLL